MEENAINNGNLFTENQNVILKLDREAIIKEAFTNKQVVNLTEQHWQKEVKKDKVYESLLNAVKLNQVLVLLENGSELDYERFILELYKRKAIKTIPIIDPNYQHKIQKHVGVDEFDIELYGQWHEQQNYSFGEYAYVVDGELVTDYDGYNELAYNYNKQLPYDKSTHEHYCDKYTKEGKRCNQLYIHSHNYNYDHKQYDKQCSSLNCQQYKLDNGSYSVMPILQGNNLLYGKTTINYLDNYTKSTIQPVKELNEQQTIALEKEQTPYPKTVEYKNTNKKKKETIYRTNNNGIGKGTNTLPYIGRIST